MDRQNAKLLSNTEVDDAVFSTVSYKHHSLDVHRCQNITPSLEYSKVLHNPLSIQLLNLLILDAKYQMCVQASLWCHFMCFMTLTIIQPMMGNHFLINISFTLSLESYFLQRYLGKCACQTMFVDLDLPFDQSASNDLDTLPINIPTKFGENPSRCCVILYMHTSLRMYKIRSSFSRSKYLYQMCGNSVKAFLRHRVHGNGTD